LLMLLLFDSFVTAQVYNMQWMTRWLIVALLTSCH